MKNLNLTLYKSSKYIHIILYNLLILLVSTSYATGQEKNISISVVDLDDKPMGRVKIVARGGRTTIVTDKNGNTKIPLASTNESAIEIESIRKSKDHNQNYVIISPWDKQLRIPTISDSSQKVVKIVLSEPGNRRLLEDTRALKALASTIIYKDVPGRFQEDSKYYLLEAIENTSRTFNIPVEVILSAIQKWGEKTKEIVEKSQADYIVQNYPKASSGFANAREFYKNSGQTMADEYFYACFFHGQSLFIERKFQESAKAYKDALKIRKDDLTTLNNLGLSLVRSGNETEAGLNIRRSLALREELYGKEHPATVRSLNSLADFLYYSLYIKEAQDMYEKAMALRKKELDNNSLATPSSLVNLAGYYTSYFQFDKAEPLLKRAVSIIEKNNGPDHLDIAEILNQLAMVYSYLRKHGETELLYKRAFSIKEKALGADHPDVYAYPIHLAEFYNGFERYDEAENLYKRAYEVKEKALGPDHPETGWSLVVLARFYNEHGKYQLAEQFFKRSLAIHENSPGLAHEDIFWGVRMLAELYESQDRYVEAETLYKRALEAKVKLLGEYHPNIKLNLFVLARCYSEQDKYKEAYALYMQALVIDEKAHGVDNPKVISSLESLIKFYDDFEKYDEAEKIYLRIYNINEKTLGPDHVDTATNLYAIADFYYKRKRYNEAIPVYNKFLAIIEKTNMGELKYSAKAVFDNSPYVGNKLKIDALESLGVIYRQSKQYAESETHFNLAISAYKNMGSSKHPELGKYYCELAKIELARGNNADAENYFKNALEYFNIKDQKDAYWFRHISEWLSEYADYLRLTNKEEATKIDALVKDIQKKILN